MLLDRPRQHLDPIRFVARRLSCRRDEPPEFLEPAGHVVQLVATRGTEVGAADVDYII